MAARTKPLTNEQRAFLVREAACYVTPKVAAEAFFAKFDRRINAQTAEGYDPTKNQGRKLKPKWITLFETCREAFLKDAAAEVPESQKSVRLRMLAGAARAMEASRNYLGMAEVLKQIAQEMGNAYTNRREYTGKDGGAMKFEDVSGMTLEQIDDEIAQIVAKGKEAAAKRQAH
jgi:hypothetical protein